MLADAIRLALVVSGLFIILLCVRVAYLRLKAPTGDRLKDSSPFALLSFALFAAIPTIEGFQSFGRPLEAWRTLLYLAALGCAVTAAFSQVSLPMWRPRTGRHRRDAPD